MKLEVLGSNGQSTGKTVEVSDEIFGIEPNGHAVYLAVKQYLAAQRQGTHKAKERGELAFSTKKIKRQKGTGTARAGSIRNPLFRKGGRIFGPRPRKYDIKLNKKVKKLARYSALSDKASTSNIVVVEDLKFDNPSTSSMAEIMQNLNLKGSKTLLVMGEKDNNVFLSGRNIPKLSSELASNLNTYEIVNADKLLVMESAIDKFV